VGVPNGAGKVRKVRVYSRPATLLNLDQRTREARMMRETRAELTAHLGGAPSTVQKLLIDRAVILRLQLALLEAKSNVGTLSERDGRQYLAWSNSLTRLLREMGVKAVAERPRTLDEIRAARTQATAA
jgi:hypothetical protein